MWFYFENSKTKHLINLNRSNGFYVSGDERIYVKNIDKDDEMIAYSDSSKRNKDYCNLIKFLQEEGK